MTSNPIDSKIRERGHWWVRIRPSEFVEDRVPSITSLYPILQRCSVQLRGWDFPHLAREDPKLQLDYIEQADEWGEHIEYWRFYKSGQFVDRLALRIDWMDEAALDPTPPEWRPGAELRVMDAVFSWTEVFEFAARLAVTEAGGESVRVEILLRGLRGRSLKVEDPRRGGFSDRYTASIEAFPFEKEVPREELVANSRHLALEAAADLFRYFGWEPSLDALRGIQDELG